MIRKLAKLQNHYILLLKAASFLYESYTNFPAPRKLNNSPKPTISVNEASSKNTKPMYVRTTSFKFPKDKYFDNEILPLILEVTGLQIVHTIRVAQVITIPITPDRNIYTKK